MKRTITIILIGLLIITLSISITFNCIVFEILDCSSVKDLHDIINKNDVIITEHDCISTSEFEEILEKHIKNQTFNITCECSKQSDTLTDVDNTNTETTQPEINVSPEVKEETSLVIWDSDGIKVTCYELTHTSFYGAELRLLVENTTDKTVVVTSQECSINGYMVNGIFSEKISSNKKVWSNLRISRSDMEEMNIIDVDTIEFRIYSYNADTWEDILLTPLIEISFEK